MHIVNIPRKFVSYSDHPYSEGYWLKDEVFDWLKSQVGAGNQGGGMTDGQVWTWVFRWEPDGPDANAIAFVDPDKALLFKLTWGGR